MLICKKANKAIIGSHRKVQGKSFRRTQYLNWKLKKLEWKSERMLKNMLSDRNAV